MAPRDKYTDPDLRDEIKEEIHNSDKGGKPGQWSARKAQMMASEYKKSGGDYTTPKETGQDSSQKHLNEWTKEEWQTKEGSGTAKQDDENGTRRRYLPKKAWEQMSEGEKEETEEKKVEGSKEGRQFVGNTGRAREARRNVNGKKGKGEEEDKDEEGDEGIEDRDSDEGENEKKTKGRKGKNRKKKESDAKENGKNKPKTRSADKEDGDQSEDGEGEGEEKKSAGTKRTAKQSTGSNKKQKENGKSDKSRQANGKKDKDGDAGEDQDEAEDDEEYVEKGDEDEDVAEEEEE